ncbi:hemagglutinin repeat-containing protein [Phyllobacterium phragmitis]|uniref:hemagglutinin repeat-containing protein n=1 Tax=Phyllobacterium phragmitis TaxID=2670329 RepID=UPI0038B33705
MTLQSRVVQALQSTQVNTHVTGTGDIKLESGRDTDLKGTIVSGETVTANVGRDLNIV